MYAIRNKKTKKWVYGTDFRVPHKRVKPNPHGIFYMDNQPIAYPHAYFSYNQRTSFNRALTFEDYEDACREFWHRGCGNDYEIVKVKLIVDGGLFDA